VPSHLWEHFATDSKSLAVLARHADTRQPLPPQLAQQLAGLSSVTPALELQQQVCGQQLRKIMNSCFF
jgi:Zn-dependent oligopeptidase